VSKILVVDDEESIRFSFKRILMNAGYEVIVTGHLIDTKAILAANEFDVAVIDRILSEGQNGLEVVKHIKEVQPFCETIMVSAYPTFKSAAKTFKHKTFAYLTKPVRKEELCRVVKDAALKRRAKMEAGHYESVLQSIFDSSPNGTVVCDLSGRVRFINPSFTRIFGYEKEEVIGKPLPNIPDRDRKKTESEIRDLLKGNTVPERETKRLAKDGGHIDVAVTPSVCRNSRGEATDILVIIRDISEKRKLEKQFHHAQKMEAVGLLAGGIAHDLNNILMAILGNSDMAMFNLPKESPARKNLRIILASVERARSLTRRILSFIRQDDQEPRLVQIQIIIKEVLNLLRAVFPNTIEICEEVDLKCGKILADPARIHQVVMNLCTNSCHAMSQSKGVLKVSLQNVEFGAWLNETDEVLQRSGNVDLKEGENRTGIQYLNSLRCIDPHNSESKTGLDPGNYIKLTVSDTGCGMDKVTMEHIFDPYFTTKAEEEGTGLGLSVTRGIVENLGGAISVESEKGKGATFCVYLPLEEETAKEKPGVTEPVSEENDCSTQVDRLKVEGFC